MSSSRKRKDRAWTDLQGSEAPADDSRRVAHGALYFQAHEADVVHGSRAAAFAASLESTSIGKPECALIRLGHNFGSEMVPEVWVDRYDTRLLLDSFHVNNPKGMDARSESPAGWSDLPSDSEDTFFFSPEETDDYRREKRRRLMGQAREERLRARIEEDGEGDEDIWGGSDEEPDESVKQVMEKTAKLILLAPNPTQMEMKILVDFGEKQPAFAFLKGRWKRRWRIIRASTGRDLKQAEELQAASKGLGGLAAYGDSDDEGSDGEASNKE